jgi:pyrroline-5-carboxylate reductase
MGIIGFGNMGRAIGLGVLRHPDLQKRFALKVYEQYPPNGEAAQQAGIPLAQSAAELAAASDIILIAVKPDQTGPLLAGIAPALSQDKTLVSIAAGVTLKTIGDVTKNACPAVRVMPNTPALVGKGIFGLCFGPGVSPAAQEALRSLFAAIGALIEISESKMNAFTALSGSGPGYVFHFLESLAEAGVSVGLDRQNSSRIALGLLQGCAAMAEESGLHPAVLREQVSSPAGTTIAGLNHLDRAGARGHLVDAVRAAKKRGDEMEKE